MSLAEGAALVAVAAGAGAQAVTGIGFSLVCAPVLTIVLGGADGVRVANVLSIGGNLLMLVRERRAADLRRVLTLLVPASLAAVATAWVIRGANPHVLAVVAGSLVLVTVAVLAWGLEAQRLAGRVGAVLAGAVSGAMNVAGSVGGPAVAGYALNARWSAAQTRATLGAYFLGINIVSVASRGVPSMSAWFFAGGALALLVGFGAGVLLARRLDETAVRSWTLALAGLGAAAAIVQGVR
ncbi:MAG TPA: TSUP family transporter [Candidatus Dormibacteraeota bacterium]|nr:TSUP family transporter [Candidatus Dormibacteraeota bacterium]